MKVVFLVLSFLVVLVLIRLFAVKLQEYLRERNFHKNQEEKRQQIENVVTNDHNTTNTDKVILRGSILNEKQNLDSKYIGNVYRAKNGRFVSKKQLTNV